MTEPLIRTGLYVPGDRPDRFERAFDSGADLVVLDLEDAVAPERKVEARAAVTAWLAAHADSSEVAIQVRVNAADEDDLRAVADLPLEVGIRLPKVERPEDVDRAARLAPGRPIIALLESPRAVLHIESIADHPAITALALGESDLRSLVGGGAPVLDHARVAAVYAAAAAELPAPMQSVYPAIEDLDGLAADTRRGAELGLFGRMVAHPKQLATVAAVFRPTPAEVTWAHEVVAAAGGVSRASGGDMIDPAMLGRARRILERT